MKHRIFAICVLLAGLDATAQALGQVQAQAPSPSSFTIKCNPNLVHYQYTATQAVSAYVCTTDATINGVAFNGLTFSQSSLTGNGVGKSWGVIVGSLTNGDMVFFEYQAVAEGTGSTISVATMSYKIVGGTGIANGISGSGSCKAVQAAGQGNEQACAGTFAVR